MPGNLVQILSHNHLKRLTMLEESMWGVVSSWFTPTMLFVYLNFMIATIFVTSGFGSHKQQQQQPHRLNNTDLQQQENQTEPFLQRLPSVLQRLKSINFYQYGNSYRSHESATVSSVEAPTQMMPIKAVCPPEDEDEYEEEDRFEHEEEEGGRDKWTEDVYGKLRVSRTKSDTEPASGAVPVKLVKKMKKSASSKSAFRHFSEAEIVEARRPATTREAKAAAEEEAEEKEDEEVDSKADDFINKFKQQLKLQRLDSILRYKEMLGRGAAK